MSGMFDEMSPLAEKLEEHLNLKECKLDDGSLVSNLDGICQMLVGKALDGDLEVVQLISKIINEKNK